MQNCSFDTCQKESRRFHGTTLRAAVSMLRSGGFIPGPNGHGYRGKYLQGLFCAEKLGEAFQRSDPWREQAEDGSLQLLGCPVVVELEVAAITDLRRYHKHRRDLRVIRGSEGVLMKGIRLRKIHINWRYLWNFCKTVDIKIGREVACGTGSNGFMTCGSFISVEDQKKVCKKWFDPAIGYKSTSGFVYCPHCYSMVARHSNTIGMPLQ